MRRRSAVVTKLELSVELLGDYLEYGHHAWLGDEDKHAFSIRTLYYLTSLSHAFELGEQPARVLLDYLRTVNQLPDLLTGDALGLAQQAASIKLAEFFGWSVREVRECVSRMELQILKDLPQLDLLIRVRVLATLTGMDALTIFLIGELPQSLASPADKAKYKDAADHALLSLSEAPAPRRSFTEELKQLVTLTCVANKPEVVPNKPGETITFTVTLLDRKSAALSGVVVRGSAALGSIVPKATNTQGIADLIYTPGKVMGTDTPLLWVDLLEPVRAPTINLVADAASANFPAPLKSRVPLDEVAFGQEVELYATLQDRHGNLFKNHPVEWSYVAQGIDAGLDTLVFRPAVSRTNQAGQTRVFVTSATGGEFEIEIKVVEHTLSTFFERIIFARQE